MKNLLISTTMIKSAIFYASATLIVFGAYFTAPIAAQAAVTTYVIDVTGNGCGNYCAELEAYLASVNANANGTSTNTNTNSTSTPNAPVAAPNLGYQYSTSTLAYYKNNQSTAATSSLYKYPTYSYFKDPNTATAAPYAYYQYPTLSYAYYNGKTSVPAQTRTAGYQAYQPATAAKLPGFIMTSGK